MIAEKQLFQSMLMGDEKALETILFEYHNYLMVVGLRYLNDKQRVEDVIQDLFADLWNKGEEVTISVSVKAFLRGCIINKCLAIIRKDNRMDYVEEHSQEIMDSAHSVDHLIDRDLLQETIDSVVDELPQKCKEVFKLSRKEGKSHQEISEQLGMHIQENDRKSYDKSA